MDLHSKKLTLLYKPGHYDVLYTIQDVADYKFLELYDKMPIKKPLEVKPEGKKLGAEKGEDEKVKEEKKTDIPSNPEEKKKFDEKPETIEKKEEKKIIEKAHKKHKKEGY